jgi:hypothetical protein
MPQHVTASNSMISMKALIAFFLVLGFHVKSVTASSDTEYSSSSALLGTWTVDVSRLSIPPEARPKQVLITFSEIQGGKWFVRVGITEAGGKQIDAVAAYALDGSSVTITGSPEADTGAAKMPTADVFILALAKGGVPASTRIYAADPDGKSMVEIAVYFGANGVPIMRTNYFSKAQYKVAN